MIDIVYRYDPATSVPPDQPATPAAAVERLVAGNQGFIKVAELAAGEKPASHVIPFDLFDIGVAENPEAAPRQQPFAAVLGCSDARVPTEMVFDQACNALFVVRVAGNVLGSECLGSLEYAVQHLGGNLRLLVVLGHSGCGAVTAAVDAFLDPARYLTVACSQSLRSVVDRLFVAVQAAADSLERVHGPNIMRQPGYRAALIETAVALNAALTARLLAHEFRDLDPAKTRVVFGVYHLVSRAVNLPGDGCDDLAPQLFYPPASEEDFRQLGRRMAGCADIVAIISPNRTEV